ncbi:MAG TPA: hypothetical protein VLH08_04730, partial [Acidobacteriota bacterium]|nr:hypothetical protein [Acidobacteriota bacterium]
MANRFNDRDRMNDRDREEHNYYFPRRDKDRFRSEGQGRPQDWRETGGQEDWDWYETSGSPYQQYGRSQEGRGPDVEGSRSAGRQDRFTNQEMNRGFGRGSEFNRGGYGQWEDQESARWGGQRGSSSRGYGSQYGNEYEGGFGQGQSNRGFGQSQSRGFRQSQYG